MTDEKSKAGASEAFEKRLSHFHTLIEIGKLITSEIELDNLLKVVVEKISEVMDAERTTIYIVDEAKHELWFKIAQDETKMEEKRLKIGTGVAGYVAETGETINVAEPYSDPRFYREIDKITGFTTTSILTIPLKSAAGKIIGVLQVLNKRRSLVFTKEDEESLVAIGTFIAVALENAQIHVKIKEENIFLKRELSNVYQFDNIIGKSESMQHVFDMIGRVCSTDVTILLNGESGTGKELAARSIHYNSQRNRQKFVAINCGSLPETLLESELFGHIRGSFTGATANKPGLFLVANGGTIFLDEIGDTSTNFQVKLLRVLEEHTLRPVGSTDDINIDVRVIAATNKDLAKAIAEGKFREDLFYRLNVINIVIPPLRDRKEDIPLLVDAQLKKSNRAKGQGITKVAPEAMQLLMNYNWPGNVRELMNVVERSVVLTDGNVLEASSLPPQIYQQKETQPRAAAASMAGLSFKNAKTNFEKEYFTGLIRRFHGNISQAAQEAGIDRRNIHVKIKRYGIGVKDLRE
jgi:Nif-specific regulatory protein